jgi:hypothetical protein
MPPKIRIGPRIVLLTVAAAATFLLVIRAYGTGKDTWELLSDLAKVWGWLELLSPETTTLLLVALGAGALGTVDYWWPRLKRLVGIGDTPFAISLSQTYADGPTPDGESPWYNTMTVRNLSRTETIDDVEVYLVRVTMMKPKRGGYRHPNLRLIERISGSPSFSLPPEASRDVVMLRKTDKDARKGEQFALGPLERLDGERYFYGPGLYKIDIAVYGRDARPAYESLAVGLDAGGSMTYGAWRDDLPWPFMRITTTIGEAPSSQSPQGTPKKTPQ